MDESLKPKIIATVTIIVVAIALLIVVSINPVNTVGDHNKGVIIDFNEYDTVWTPEELSNVNAEEALRIACEKNSYSLTFNNDGSVAEINGCYSIDDCKWELWKIDKGSAEWKILSAPYDYKIDNYAAVCWAYRNIGEDPTIAVDLRGVSIYEHGIVNKAVTLSAAFTEDLCAVNGENKIVGTDMFSNYPRSIVSKQNSGDISIVGDFTTVNFESIVKLNPDVVFCDATRSNHVQTYDKLISAGYSAYLLDCNDDINSITDNIFVIGQVTGCSKETKELFAKYNEAVNTISKIIGPAENSKQTKIAFTLSADKMPWVAGKNTYVNNISLLTHGDNVFTDVKSWAQINPEELLAKNPSIIIIFSDTYKNTDEDYNNMLNSLSLEWKNTDAYKSGRIYLFTESATDMSQRPCSRFIQLYEITARIINPDVMSDITVNRHIGDDYRNFLSYTKNIIEEGE